MTLRPYIALLCALALLSCGGKGLDETGVEFVTLEVINAQPAYYHGKKVRVRGLLVLEFENVGIYSSLETYYWLEDGFGVGVSVGENIYKHDEDFNRAMVEVVGTFDDSCGNVVDDELLLCIGTPGPGIIEDVIEVKKLSPPWQRLSMDEIPADLAHFTIANKDWQHYAALSETALSVFQAIKDGDLDKMVSYLVEESREFHRREYADPDSDFYYFKQDSPFPHFSGSDDDTHFAILIPSQTHFYNDDPTYACFCLTDDCSAEWPILRQDVITHGPINYDCEPFTLRNGMWYWH